MIPIFVGYDPREAIAYHVCTNSIIRHATVPVSLTPCALNTLQGYKEPYTDGSNHFTYSRFLVPHLMQYRGWAIFIDGDMLLKDDIAELWKLRDDTKAVMVVKHDYKTKMKTKYLGAPNEDYPRKNWSSVIMWNCAHPANRFLTPASVEDSTGSQLHRFSWIHNDDVGSLPLEWNWLDIEYEKNANAKLVHYTLGAPCFVEFSAQGNYANEWHQERILTEHCQQRNDRT